jgi:N-acetyl sugar amidotransferase
MQYCKKCLTPNTRPRIVFDSEGVCNACRFAEDKHNKIDWEARKKEFLELIEPYRSKDGYWDCVVPWSGGKDSSLVAYRLKKEFGMNPLLATFSPQLPTDVGNHNREALIEQGFDNIFLRPDQKVHRKLAKRFFIERGDLKVAWTAGINSYPIKVATKFKIPLVFWAEYSEGEYGGKVLNEKAKKMRDFTEVLEHGIGDDPRNWVDDEVTEKDLNPYIYPSLEEIEKVGVKVMYFSYFFKWSLQNNYNYVQSKFDFRAHPNGRTPGTFTNFDSLDDKTDNLYYYLQYIKFGFGRGVRDASRMIQNKHLTREQALELCKKYDGEFPDEYLSDVLEYLHMSKQELLEIVDKHRNPEIWKFENGQWKLRYPLQ